MNGNEESPENSAAAQAIQDSLTENAALRTIYVGNLASSISEDFVVTFFSCCGQVINCRPAADPVYAARFAFVEFADPKAAINACSLTGTVIADRPLRIKMSKTPITPPNPILGV